LLQIPNIHRAEEEEAGEKEPIRAKKETNPGPITQGGYKR